MKIAKIYNVVGQITGVALAGFVGALLLVVSTQAEDKLPTAQHQEILIKTTLLTLNDANLTGNYTVLHAKLAKPFREQFKPDQLKKVFKGFVDQKADWSLIVTRQPIATAEAKIDNRGVLLLRGYFDTRPSRLIYELDFLPSEGEWKPLNLHVNAKPLKEG